MCSKLEFSMFYLQVADSQKHADIAANLVVIDYNTKDLEPPILSIEEAIEKSSLFDIPPPLRCYPVGDITKGMGEAEHKILGSKVVPFQNVNVSQALLLSFNHINLCDFCKYVDKFRVTVLLLYGDTNSSCSSG